MINKKMTAVTVVKNGSRVLPPRSSTIIPPVSAPSAPTSTSTSRSARRSGSGGRGRASVVTV